MTQPRGQGARHELRHRRAHRAARQVQAAVLTAFAQTGRAPARAELDRIARSHRADPDAVLADLAGADAIALGADGEIRAAYPFSPAPTAIQVTWAGGPLTYAMCAIDALGISAMLGRPVTITAAEPGTGRAITVQADGDQAAWTPAGAVVLAGATGDAGRPPADRTCGYINFFTSAEAASDWADRHPAIRGEILDQARALAQGITQFGTLMRR